MKLKTTLDQWQTLLEIDKAGSIQAAALSLNKSHTTLIYAVKKLEAQLDLPLLRIEGRKAVLTDQGKSLLRRAKAMLEQARTLEELSTQIASGLESQLVVAIDHLCDRSWLFQPMSEFFAHNSGTSVKVVETSLSKTTQMVVEEQADISIINLPIKDYPSETFALVKLYPVVASQHPLAVIPSPTTADLAINRQIVIRDLGDTSQQDVGWLKSNQRITVDNFDHAWQAVTLGLGYCRVPHHVIERYRDPNVSVLNLEHAHSYQVPLHLTLPKGAKTGPAAKHLYQLLLASAAQRAAP
ncbi:LysR family transcriptional regulator [Shewanella alkalitolerans]|uniref:LysR family transcriptional regulator n=1 Tax=Shewanella alkalitolerans TaxID=2864209 RepID=UPI001C6612E5|nr:LysR family transcriptional regulator [Shewanella alkalitolerans]QYJ96924.1 LysR family transcriptional regulator [Shewanella alkalitolerans]